MREGGIDLQGMSSRTIGGDAHFFDDATSPTKVRQYLDAIKVCLTYVCTCSYYL